MLGDVSGFPVQVEFVAAGVGPLGSDPAAARPSAFWSWAETGAAGSFVVEGLLDQPYRLAAIDTVSLLATTSAPVPAGATDVKLVLDRTRCHARVAGRVVSRLGTPLAGVVITCVHEGYVTAGSAQGATCSSSLSGAKTTTDKDGGFELLDVPRDGVRVWADGRGVVAQGQRLRPDEDVTKLEIVVSTRCHFRVEPADPSAPLGVAFSLLEADGRERWIDVHRPGNRVSSISSPLVDGHSQIVSTLDGPCVLVVEHGDGSTTRVPVVLRPDGPNVMMY